MEGFLTCTRICDPEGRMLNLSRAVDYGWLKPVKSPAGWDIGSDELPLGKNLWVDSGRQLIAFAIGGRSPLSDFTLTSFGAGTGTTPATVVDTALTSPVTLSTGVIKPVDSVDFPAPFILRANFTLAAGEANGYLLTEFGLFSSTGNMFTHVVNTGLNKTSDWSPSLSWRVRV